MSSDPRLFNYRAIVNTVVDGDTVDVTVDLGFHIYVALKLRLDGIDAPEMKTEAGKAARLALLARGLTGAAVVITTTLDKQEKYGRYLAVVEQDGVNVNQWMIDNGYAVEYHGGKRA